MRISAFARGMGPRPTGRGFLAYEILHALRRLHPEMSLQVFMGEPTAWPGVDVRPGRSSNVFGDALRVLRGIGREIGEWKPDVLWSASHFLPGGVPDSIPSVVTLLDLVWRDHPETMSRGRRWAASWLERGLFRARRIGCISEFTRTRLVAHFPELAPKAWVLPLGPNPRLPSTADAAPVLKRLEIPARFILNVDTVEPRKNLGVLLDAMARRPDLTLIQCGGRGWNVDDLVKRASSLKNVRLLGYATEEELSALYRSALAAVFPSLYEGFHLPPLDAQNLGCPVVASDIPVHREVLGDAPWYVPAKDPEALGRAIDTAIAGSAERVAAGRKNAAAYSWDRSAEELWAAFGKL